MSYLGTTKIGKMYLGNTGIAKAYLGNTLVFQNGGGPTPPTPANIAYIRGGADGQYIDTGITPDNTTKVIVWARNFNPTAGDYTWLFGSRISYQNAMFSLIADKGKETGAFGICYGANALQDVREQWAYLSHYHKYEFGPDGFLVDDVLVASITASTFSSEITIHLLGENTNGVHTNANSNIDVCACKIYKGGTLVRDFSPAQTPSIGLYDAVSGNLFTNDGSGSFTYGTFDSNAYTPLEYITTGAGGSYFLSPVVGTYGLPVVARVMPTSNDAAYFDFCSGRDATNRFQLFVGNSTNNYSCRKLSAILGTGSATDMSSGNADGYFRNKELTFVKANNKVEAYYQNAKQGNTYTSGVNSSYSTGVRVCVGAVYRAESDIYNNYFVGNLYYFGFGDYNYVPAKVNNVAGFYDTYNDVFKPSESGVPFVAGPTI